MIQMFVNNKEEHERLVKAVLGIPHMSQIQLDGILDGTQKKIPVPPEFLQHVVDNIEEDIEEAYHMGDICMGVGSEGIAEYARSYAKENVNAIAGIMWDSYWDALHKYHPKD